MAPAEHGPSTADDEWLEVCSIGSSHSTAWSLVSEQRIARPDAAVDNSRSLAGSSSVDEVRSVTGSSFVDVDGDLDVGSMSECCDSDVRSLSQFDFDLLSTDDLEDDCMSESGSICTERGWPKVSAGLRKGALPILRLMSYREALMRNAKEHQDAVAPHDLREKARRDAMMRQWSEGIKPSHDPNRAWTVRSQQTIRGLHLAPSAMRLRLRGVRGGSRSVMDLIDEETCGFESFD